MRAVSAWELQDWMIDRYLEGRMPIPGPLLQRLLNTTMEAFFRFAPVMDVLPDAWSGGHGPLAQRSDDLMRIHYDRPAVLFESFLGPSMKYSMALWERGARTLEQAQEDMLSDLCEKAQIRDGDAILDIGCGFGTFVGHVLRNYPHSSVVGITLSDVQYRHLTEKQKCSGHQLHDERLRVIKGDFATCDLDMTFDRIVSIGVFEHLSNLRVALEKIARLLRQDGTVLLHFIVYQRIIEAVANIEREGFFARYIFPGSRFWPFNELPRYQEHLRVERAWFLNGRNYRRTLEAWRRNLWRNADVIRSHPDLDEQFMRLWDLYLRICIAIFRSGGGRYVGNGQYLLRHAHTAS